MKLEVVVEYDSNFPSTNHGSVDTGMSPRGGRGNLHNFGPYFQRTKTMINGMKGKFPKN